MSDFDAIQKALNQSSAIYRDAHQGALPFTDALFCAQDVIRNRAFFWAIQKAVSDLKTRFDSVRVIDAGCGTGLLGLYALLAGADHCTFLDNNPDAISFTTSFLTQFDLMDRSTVALADAKTYQPNEPFHLLISETIAAGFIEEDFPVIVNHLKTFLDPNGVIIPEGFELIIIEQPSGISNLYQLVSDRLIIPSITDSNTRTTEYVMHTRLYDSVRLESGQCNSYCNPRMVSISA